MYLFLTLCLSLQAGGAPQPDVDALTVGTPAAIAELDTGKLKGDPSRLAWSPDATQFYVQAEQRDRTGNVTVRHYLLALDGRGSQAIPAEPAWAAKYWTWKSAQAAPGLPAFRIALETRQQLVRATAAPMGGDLARGDPGSGAGGSGAGSGLSAGEAAGVAQQTQTVTVATMRLKGETIGEWANTPIVPGLTFGWAPASLGLIAYANKEGRVVLMDPQGRRQEIAGSKEARLPAWTEDGRRLAYVQRKDKKRFTLFIVDVSKP